MRYVCLLYFDPQSVFNQSPEADAVLARGRAPRRRVEGQRSPRDGPALVLPERSHDRARARREDVGDRRSVHGDQGDAGRPFILIEARDLNEAVQIAAGIPFAKLGSVEVRPVVDFSKPRPKL